MRVALLLALLAASGCMAAESRTSGAPGGNNGGGSGSNEPPSGSDTGGSSGGPGMTPRADAGASAADAYGGGGESPDGSVVLPCAVLMPISASSFQDLPAAPGSKLRVRVKVTDNGAAPAQWTWMATFGDGVGTEVPVTSLDPLSTEVELPLEKAGRYQLTASATVRTNPCTVTAIASATAADRRLGHFRVRITPPSGPFPVQELPVQAMAGVPVTQPLAVQQGQPVTFQPQDELGTKGIASYVRVNQLGSSLAVEGHTGLADFKPALLATHSYDVLFVPDEEVAPFVALGLTPAALNVLSQKLTPGGSLTGTLRDGSGAPLRDGRVILRAGALTSTVGKSSAAGDYSLRVRAGQFAVTASPDPASGLPELSLPPESGVVVEDGALLGTLDVAWSPVTPVAVRVVVRAADGVVPAAGARVRLERATPMAGAGTFTFKPATGAPVTRMMPGSVRLNGQVGADGSLAFARVPPGAYRLLVTPADTDKASALTISPLDVPAGGVSGQTVRLAAKVKLRGLLQPVQMAAGSRVYATPREVDPPRPVAAAVVGADGTYALDVDPERSYVVWADPGLGKPFARAQLARIDAGPTGATVPDRNLPKALAFSGTLMGEAAGTRIPGAVIQIFCDAAAASCLDPGITLGEGVSDRDGTFTLSLPDPGSF